MALLHSRCEVTALVDCVRVLFKVVPVLWVDVKEREEAGYSKSVGAHSHMKQDLFRHFYLFNKDDIIYLGQHGPTGRNNLQTQSYCGVPSRSR